ncbi:ABC transporter permease [Streptomyces sp. NPDC048664]|uniref:ABC transporter permease n=1 Tax=Streptomyces sp. NPDC048664 TaxID=3154505 RepID=UPI003432FD63
MSFWEYLAGHHHRLLVDAFRHAGIVLPCAACAAVLGVLIAVAARRSERAGRLAAATTGALPTVPALAMIGLLVPVVGPGVAPTLTVLTLCGLLPVLRSSLAGLRTAGPPRTTAPDAADAPAADAVADAATGAEDTTGAGTTGAGAAGRAWRLGRAGRARPARVGVAGAWPSILTGMRTSTRLLMGVAALTAYVSGPGLGNEIFRGLGAPGSENALNEVLAGTLGIVVLSLLSDAAYLCLGRLTLPRRPAPAAPARPEEKPT